MRRISLFFSIIMIAVCAYGQPKWAKKAAKSVFTVKTFSGNGTMIASSNGFYIGTDGEAVSNFTPFRGASKAIIIDAQGQEYDVEHILGANETYDVVKFRVTARHTVPLPIATEALGGNATVWLLPYAMKKTPDCPQGRISKAESFNDNYTYYTISLHAPDNAVSCPFLNENGEVVGILQQSADERDTMSYAVSAGFAADQKITGLSLNDRTLKSTYIKKALPDEASQAILTLYMASATMDSAAYNDIVNEFITKFPNVADGYTYRAQIACNGGRFADAEKDMEKAIKVAEKKDDAHYYYARLIYQKEVYQAGIPYPNWTLDKAAQEADEAYSITPSPAYRQLKAQILFAKKDYRGAYDTYREIASRGTRTADVFFEASRCCEMLNDTTAMLAMLDSAVNTFSKPYLKEAAPYILARAQALTATGRFRPAVADLNEYESLMQTSLNDNFYYIRSQAEMGGHMFQQALNDIAKAIQLKPDNTLYYAEKASIEVRVGLTDDAIATSGECIRLAPELSDGYLFLGIAQCVKGDKTEGIKNLQKAKELGNTQAEPLIEKYQKQ